jgi:hypothetical protein
VRLLHVVDAPEEPGQKPVLTSHLKHLELQLRLASTHLGLPCEGLLSTVEPQTRLASLLLWGYYDLAGAVQVVLRNAHSVRISASVVDGYMRLAGDVLGALQAPVGIGDASDPQVEALHRVLQAEEAFAEGVHQELSAQARAALEAGKGALVRVQRLVGRLESYPGRGRTLIEALLDRKLRAEETLLESDYQKLKANYDRITRRRDNLRKEHEARLKDRESKVSTARADIEMLVDATAATVKAEADIERIRSRVRDMLSGQPDFSRCFTLAWDRRFQRQVECYRISFDGQGAAGKTGFKEEIASVRAVLEGNKVVLPCEVRGKSAVIVVPFEVVATLARASLTKLELEIVLQCGRGFWGTTLAAKIYKTTVFLPRHGDGVQIATTYVLLQQSAGTDAQVMLQLGFKEVAKWRVVVPAESEDESRTFPRVSDTIERIRALALECAVPITAPVLDSLPDEPERFRSDALKEIRRKNDRQRQAYDGNRGLLELLQAVPTALYGLSGVGRANRAFDLAEQCMEYLTRVESAVPRLRDLRHTLDTVELVRIPAGATSVGTSRDQIACEGLLDARRAAVGDLVCLTDVLREAAAVEVLHAGVLAVSAAAVTAPNTMELNKATQLARRLEAILPEIIESYSPRRHAINYREATGKPSALQLTHLYTAILEGAKHASRRRTLRFDNLRRSAALVEPARARRRSGARPPRATLQEAFEGVAPGEVSAQTLQIRQGEGGALHFSVPALLVDLGVVVQQPDGEDTVTRRLTLENTTSLFLTVGVEVSGPEAGPLRFEPSRQLRLLPLNSAALTCSLHRSLGEGQQSFAFRLHVSTEEAGAGLAGGAASVRGSGSPLTGLVTATVHHVEVRAEVESVDFGYRLANSGWQTFPLVLVNPSSVDATVTLCAEVGDAPDALPLSLSRTTGSVPGNGRLPIEVKIDTSLHGSRIGGAIVVHVFVGTGQPRIRSFTIPVAGTLIKSCFSLGPAPKGFSDGSPSPCKLTVIEAGLAVGEHPVPDARTARFSIEPAALYFSPLLVGSYSRPPKRTLFIRERVGLEQRVSVRLPDAEAGFIRLYETGLSVGGTVLRPHNSCAIDLLAEGQAEVWGLQGNVELEVDGRTTRVPCGAAAFPRDIAMPDSQIGGSCSLRLFLSNHNPVPLRFEMAFKGVGSSNFAVIPPTGTVPEGGAVGVTLTFKPTRRTAGCLKATLTALVAGCEAVDIPVVGQVGQARLKTDGLPRIPVDVERLSVLTDSQRRVVRGLPFQCTVVNEGSGGCEVFFAKTSEVQFADPAMERRVIGRGERVQLDLVLRPTTLAPGRRSFCLQQQGSAQPLKCPYELQVIGPVMSVTSSVNLKRFAGTPSAPAVFSVTNRGSDGSSTHLEYACPVICVESGFDDAPRLTLGSRESTEGSLRLRPGKKHEWQIDMRGVRPGRVKAIITVFAVNEAFISPNGVLGRGVQHSILVTGVYAPCSDPAVNIRTPSSTSLSVPQLVSAPPLGVIHLLTSPTVPESSQTVAYALLAAFLARQGPPKSVLDQAEDRSGAHLLGLGPAVMAEVLARPSGGLDGEGESAARRAIVVLEEPHTSLSSRLEALMGFMEAELRDRSGLLVFDLARRLLQEPAGAGLEACVAFASLKACRSDDAAGGDEASSACVLKALGALLARRGPCEESLGDLLVELLGAQCQAVRLLRPCFRGMAALEGTASELCLALIRGLPALTMDEASCRAVRALCTEPNWPEGVVSLADLVLDVLAEEAALPPAVTEGLQAVVGGRADATAVLALAQRWCSEEPSVSAGFTAGLSLVDLVLKDSTTTVISFHEELCAAASLPQALAVLPQTLRCLPFTGTGRRSTAASYKGVVGLLRALSEGLAGAEMAAESVVARLESGGAELLVQLVEEGRADRAEIACPLSEEVLGSAATMEEGIVSTAAIAALRQVSTLAARGPFDVLATACATLVLSVMELSSDERSLVLKRRRAIIALYERLVPGGGHSTVPVRELASEATEMLEATPRGHSAQHFSRLIQRLIASQANEAGKSVRGATEALAALALADLGAEQSAGAATLKSLVRMLRVLRNAPHEVGTAEVLLAAIGRFVAASGSGGNPAAQVVQRLSVVVGAVKRGESPAAILEQYVGEGLPGQALRELQQAQQAFLASPLRGSEFEQARYLADVLAGVLGRDSPEASALAGSLPFMYGLSLAKAPSVGTLPRASAWLACTMGVLRLQNEGLLRPTCGEPTLSPSRSSASFSPPQNRPPSQPAVGAAGRQRRQSSADVALTVAPMVVSAPAPAPAVKHPGPFRADDVVAEAVRLQARQGAGGYVEVFVDSQQQLEAVERQVLSAEHVLDIPRLVLGDGVDLMPAKSYLEGLQHLEDGARSWRCAFARCLQLSVHAVGSEDEAELAERLVRGATRLLSMAGMLHLRLRNVGDNTSALVLSEVMRTVYCQFRQLHLSEASRQEFRPLLRDLKKVFASSEDAVERTPMAEERSRTARRQVQGARGDDDDDDPFEHLGDRRYLPKPGQAADVRHGGRQGAAAGDADMGVVGALAAALNLAGDEATGLAGDEDFLMVHDLSGLHITLEDVKLKQPQRDDGGTAESKDERGVEEEDEDDDGRRGGRAGVGRQSNVTTFLKQALACDQEKRPAQQRQQQRRHAPSARARALNEREAVDVVSAEDAADKEHVEKILAKINIGLDAKAIRNLIDKSDIADIYAHTARTGRGDNRKVRASHEQYNLIEIIQD